MGLRGEPRLPAGADREVRPPALLPEPLLLRRRLDRRACLAAFDSRARPSAGDAAPLPHRLQRRAPGDVARRGKRPRPAGDPSRDRRRRSRRRRRAAHRNVLRAADPAPARPGRDARSLRHPPLPRGDRAERAGPHRLDRRALGRPASGGDVPHVRAGRAPRGNAGSRCVRRLRRPLRRPGGPAVDAGLERHIRPAADGAGGAAAGPVHAGREDRRGWDGRRLPRESLAAATADGDQDPSARASGGDGPRPVRARGPDDFATDLAAHGLRLRLRPHARRSLLLRDGVPRRNRPRRARPGGRPDACRTRRPRAPAGLRGARRGAPRGVDPPRHQAGQHPALRARGTAGRREGRGLRAREERRGDGRAASRSRTRPSGRRTTWPPRRFARPSASTSAATSMPWERRRTSC